MGMLLLILVFCTISITKSGGVTDKEYANLPPVFEQDNFERCLLLKDEALYCYVEYHVKPIDPENASITWTHIQDLSANPKNYRHDILRHGVCIPFSCPNISRSHRDPEFRRDLAECINRKYKHLGIYGTVEHDYCQTDEPPKYDFLDRLAAVLLIVYVLFVLFASFYEGFARYKTPEEYLSITTSRYGKLVSCFSIPKNWERLKTIEWTPENYKLKGVHGFRFYNMFLVIAVHAAVLCVAGPISNTKFIEGLFHHRYMMFMASGPFGVSTFFQISSMLLTFSVLNHFNEKSEKELTLKTIFWIVIYRYLRLTPTMAFILFLHSTILPHSGSGPMWNEYLGIDRRNCRKNGWTNLLYINTWVNTSEMCMLETWYLSVDMQAFILVLVFLYFTAKSPKRFWSFLIIAWILHLIYVAWHVYSKAVFYFMRPYPENMYIIKGLYEEDGVWINTLAHGPMNYASTFVGVAVGFVLSKYDKVPTPSSRIGQILYWFGVWGVAVSIVGIPGTWLYSKNYYDSYWFSIPYLTFSPTIYSAAIALGSLGIAAGHGWMTKWVLEWRPTYFLGRISYSTFLAHYPLLFYILGSSKNLMSVNEINILLETGKILSISLVCGLMLSLFIEYPVSAFSSLLLKDKIVNETKKNDIKPKTS
ncbi:nose resistant to fluoxetine protein 6-like [Coccinella septempunctata]|uniref:nose resistant to fluoxetine protein 6-like n=1 Tax=Coccinella septempunctata TaxID=41139 RepID=UPI001D08C7A6|nr:nose resistant to fluoxetine protein 6-like [Coccinella septempunctata]